MTTKLILIIFLLFRSLRGSFITGDMSLDITQFWACSYSSDFTFRLTLPQNTNSGILGQSYNLQITLPLGFMVVSNSFDIIFNGATLAGVIQAYGNGIRISNVIFPSSASNLELRLRNVNSAIQNSFFSQYDKFTVLFHNSLHQIFFEKAKEMEASEPLGIIRK